MNNLYQLIDNLIKNSKIPGIRLFQNQYVEILINKENIMEFLNLIRDDEDLSFAILSDLFAADFPDRDKRFEIVYNLFSLKLNDRLIVKTYLDDQEKISSVSSLYSVANWYEREIYDLFGVEFENHPDMRRLLTDYGFVGHPLRKDFPLSGHVQVKYDEVLEKVVNEPVKLDQEYRYFDSISPWQKNPIAPKNDIKG
jgi:NADH-quinone oxidoreductase subunit C